MSGDPGAAARHEAKVRRVAGSLASRERGRPVSFLKRAVSHQVPKRGDLKYSDEKIDVTDLDEILSIDPQTRTCTAEPGVTFVDLVKATLPLGLVPAVVPELKTITLGGAVAGCSLESMSFRYGGFHDTCLEYEVITTTGDVLQCARGGRHALIFEMQHGSFGTLGFLSRLRFKLVEAKPFVHVRHERHETFAAYRDAIEIHRRRVGEGVETDFMDGFIHRPRCMTLATGRFVDRAPYTTRYDGMKVFHESTLTRDEDYLETTQYFFRYDHGVTNVHPRTALGRLLFGRLMSSATLLRTAEKLNRLLPAEGPPVIVDLFIPASRVESFLAWYDQTFAHYPLWCVPYARVRDYPWIADSFYSGLEDDLFFDLAIYGMTQPRGRNCHKEIEDRLPAFGGIKTLISHNFYDESTFWKIFNRPNYDAAKSVTDPKALLRDLYDKTCLASRGLSRR